MSVRLELNDEIRDALRIPPEEQEGRLRREIALRLYEKKDYFPLEKLDRLLEWKNGMLFY
jgi:hypothetical protein